jgi:hypothetical protein
MSDIREQVVRAVHNEVTGDDIGYLGCADYSLCHTIADAALAVAEPLIRAQVIEGLAKKVEPSWHFQPGTAFAKGEPTWTSVADWLRAQIDEPDDRKIYIGFKDKQKDKDRD